MWIEYLYQWIYKRKRFSIENGFRVLRSEAWA